MTLVNLSKLDHTQYVLSAGACTHCGRPSTYVFEFRINRHASSMMASVRTATGVGHQDTNKNHIELADSFDKIIAELDAHASSYAAQIKGTPSDRWFYFGQIIDGMRQFVIEARKLKDATVEITYPE